MFARIENNQIVEYPLTEWDIRQRIDVFGLTANFDVLVPTEYVRVQEGPRPALSGDEKAVELTPIIVEGKWTRNWSVVQKTPEEIEPIELSPAEQEMLATPKPNVPDIYTLVWDEENKEWDAVLNHGAL